MKKIKYPNERARLVALLERSKELHLPLPIKNPELNLLLTEGMARKIKTYKGHVGRGKISDIAIITLAS